MEKSNDRKYVYIFGNKLLGFHGHTYYKEDAKNILKTRKNLEMVKIENDKFCKENLSVNTEFLNCYDNIYITADEEEYFIEAFSNFQDEIIHTINDLLEYLKYFKFNKKEKFIIDYLIAYLSDYQYFIQRGQYEDGGMEAYDETFDTEAAIRWFLKNVLE